MLGMNSAWTRRSTPVRAYEAPVGSVAAGAAFKDAWILDDVEPFESLVAWCDAGRGYRPGRHLARYRTLAILTELLRFSIGTPGKEAS